MGNSLVAFCFMSDSANLIHSPLHQRHIELGAKLAPFGGWEMPLEYAGGGVLAEHAATRDAVGIFDVSHLGTATLTGPNAADRLNEVLTNDINRIKPGQAQYSTILSENGTVVDDLIVYLRSKEEVLLIPNAGNSTTVLEIIKKNIPSDIVVKNLHSDIAIIAIQGPKSIELVTDLGLPTDMEYMSFKDVSFMGNSVTICRTGYTGEKGFEVLVPAVNALNFWDEVFKKGQKFGAKAVGLGARDTLRTEMGYPLHGQDISLNISPLEAGLNWAVILDKPKFLGKDALVKEKASGVKRKLVGIKAVERAIPRSHMKVLDQSNHELGEITSGTFSPTLREGIALALLESSVKVGDKVFVDVRGKNVEFLVTKPPFVESKVR
jgi:aminomethyltransferase